MSDQILVPRWIVVVMCLLLCAGAVLDIGNEVTSDDPSVLFAMSAVARTALWFALAALYWTQGKAS